MIQQFLTNLNILLGLHYYDTKILVKFKYFIKIL
jgi:hypothetical protein